MVDSVSVFYKNLFRVASPTEETLFLKGELDEEFYLSIKEKELKNLYEKFCFLNHCMPQSLTDENNLQKLAVYGFMIVNDDDNASVFAKLSYKAEPSEPKSTQLNTKDTLALFIEMNYDVTGIPSDTEWVEDFEEKYASFCREYRLP